MRLEDLKPGMRLAKDIFDPNGNILMRAGAPVTDRLIRAFKSWGIGEAAIQSDPDGTDEPARDPSVAAEVRTLLDTQFSLSNRDHPVVQALYDLCLDRALGKR